ncbi:MAG: Pr6Pr family membrane protein [Thermomicrobiales bacterium]
MAIPRETAWWVRAYRLIAGLAGLVTIVSLLSTSPHVGNFFSFFTIQSNLIAVVVLLVGAVVLPRPSVGWDLIRGGAAIYMMLTGVIYNTLLVGLEDSLDTTAPWANAMVHTIIPIVMAVDFLLIPLSHRLRWREALVWTVYPLAYLAYSLIRGPIVDWYPYPFLDPRRDGGYPQVAAMCVAILIGFLAVVWLMTEINAWRLRSGAAMRVA